MLSRPSHLDKLEVAEHGSKLLLIAGLVDEIQLVGEVPAYFVRQPLEVEAGKQPRRTVHQELGGRGREEKPAAKTEQSNVLIIQGIDIYRDLLLLDKHYPFMAVKVHLHVLV